MLVGYLRATSQRGGILKGGSDSVNIKFRKKPIICLFGYFANKKKGNLFILKANKVIP